MANKNTQCFFKIKVVGEEMEPASEGHSLEERQGPRNEVVEQLGKPEGLQQATQARRGLGVGTEC